MYPRRFNQIVLQIRFCDRPSVLVVRFRLLGFLQTHSADLFRAARQMTLPLEEA
jgi:hypothetical protein